MTLVVTKAKRHNVDINDSNSIGMGMESNIRKKSIKFLKFLLCLIVHFYESFSSTKEMVETLRSKLT